MGPRYPAIDEKPAMAGETVMGDVLSFEAAFESDTNDPLWLKIGHSTVNWMLTNRQGMTFGVLIGAPPGVCVNCAAPIAYGMRNEGVRNETSLAVTFASPTLNIIVLAMMFSVLPLYLAVTKLMVTFLFLLLVLPLLLRWFFREAPVSGGGAASAPCLTRQPRRAGRRVPSAFPCRSFQISRNGKGPHRQQCGPMDNDTAESGLSAVALLLYLIELRVEIVDGIQPGILFLVVSKQPHYCPPAFSASSTRASPTDPSMIMVQPAKIRRMPTSTPTSHTAETGNCRQIITPRMMDTMPLNTIQPQPSNGRQRKPWIRVMMPSMKNQMARNRVIVARPASGWPTNESPANTASRPNRNLKNPSPKDLDFKV